MSSVAPPAAARGLRERVAQWIEQAAVQRFVLAVIVANAVLLGLETSTTLMSRMGEALVAADRAILAFFVVEIGARLFVHRAAFFRDPWSVFDFAVVAIGVVPGTAHLTVLRALRVLRVLRLVTVVPSMRRVVGSLLAAIPGLGSIAVVLMLVFYIFGVIATHLFSGQFPDWFGHLGRSVYTLFQVMTLESWSMGISRPVMQKFPYAWAFFVPFILIATFTMLNLFIAIIVSAVQSFSEAEQAQTLAAVDEAREHIEADLRSEVRSLRAEMTEVRALRAEIAELRALLQQARPPG